MSDQKAPSFLDQIRNPVTRGKAVRTLLVGIVLASGSISGTIIGTQSTFGFWSVLMERLQFPMIQAEIESLRKDVQAAPCGSNAMLLNQAAETNKRIEHEHESNKHVYSDWASTDRWNQVQRIETPCEPPSLPQQ